MSDSFRSERWRGHTAVCGDITEDIVFDLRPEMTYSEKITVSMTLPIGGRRRRLDTYLRATFKAFLPWECSDLEFTADLGAMITPLQHVKRTA